MKSKWGKPTKLASLLKKFKTDENAVADGVPATMDTSDPVSQFGCLFIIFVFDGFLHHTPQSNHFRLQLSIVSPSLGSLSNMVVVAMNIHQQRLEFRCKERVIIRAT